MSTMARTAVVAGTATAVSNKVTASGQAKAQAAQQQQMAAAEAQQAALQQAAQQAAQEELARMQSTMQTQEAAIATSHAGSTIEKLKELAQLKDAGMLTDEEFSAAKAKVLAG
jgi:hypothetical protein